MSSLLRSTKFVRYFAGAARTLILNSAKTAENNLLINSKALGVANNVLMRDYASKKETLDPLLLRLDSEVRRFGRISKRDIDEVFDELRAKSNITSSQSLLVIRCCGELVPEELPEQRTLLVQKIWSVLTERGVPMDISHYNALLRVYIENEHAFSPAEFLEELEKKGLQPNRVTYQRLMWRYCQEGDVEGATRVLERMRELHFPVSEPVLNALIMGHAFHGDTDGAKAVLETMAGAGLQPSNRTYALLACGFARKGDLEGVESAFKTAVEKDAYLSDKDVLDVIEALAVAGHGDKIEAVFSHLPKGPGYITDICNVVLKLINKGQEEVAKTLMRTMPNNEKSETDTLYKGAFFVKQLVKINKSVEATVKLCKELQAENLVPSALYIATESAIQQGNSQLAIELFKELQNAGLEIRLHYYWPLLAKKGKENDEEGLLQLLRDMANSGLSPTGETLRDYVIPYLLKKASAQNVITKLQIGNIPAIHAARNVMVELLHNGKIKDAADIAQQYQPFGQYNLIGRPLITSLAKTKDVKSFVKILHVISSKIASAEQDAVNDEALNDDRTDSDVGKIVKSAVKNIPADLVDALLTELLAKGLSISTHSAEQIQQYLGQNLTGSISEKLTQLTAADLEIVPIEQVKRTNTSVIRNSAYLERLLEIAKAKGENLFRLQKQLITLYVQENNVEKLTPFLDDLKNQDFELTNASLAQLFEFYCHNNQIEKALEIKQKLDSVEPKFVLNKIKIIHMAYALVRADKPDEALKFLKENENEDQELSEFVLNSKCWQMVNYLAEQKNVEKVKEMTQALIDHHYAEPSNVLLGPSIKVHLLVSDVSGALSEFERCCKVYRSTPWKGELMKALILQEDATRLQWLADLSTQIHGEVNILHDLVLAFVECGRLRQARRILETPGMQTRQRRLDDAAQRYVQEGKSEYLEGLLEATKELSHIDRSNIFYHLLVTYCKANETDKAFGLWTLLQEDGEVPSDQFLTHLGKHLQEKNRPVPFVVPQTTTPIVEKNQKTDVHSKPRISKAESTTAIEQFINDGKANEAANYAIRTIKEGSMPKTPVLKYLLKNLADAGNVAKIEALGKELSEDMKRNVTYDDKLTLAIFKKGAGDKHVENLHRSVQNATTEEDFEEALKSFPKSTALASIVEKKEDSLKQCHEIAMLAASKGHYMPANLLWMEYLLIGNTQDADAIFSQHLTKATNIAFRRLLQESHNKNDPKLIEKLIGDLKTNSNITTAAIGNPYSRLINLYLTHGEIEKAAVTLDKALGEGIALEDINRSSLKKLKAAVESIGQEFKHAVNSKE